MKAVLFKVGALVATAIFGLSQPAQAGDWIVAGNSSETAVGIDLNTLRVAPNQYGRTTRMVGWVIWVSRDPSSLLGDAYDYRLTRDIADCESGTKASGASTLYKIDQESSVGSYPGSPSDFQAMVPDSLGYAVWEAMCDSVQSRKGTGHETAEEFASDVRFLLRNPRTQEDYSAFPEKP